MDNSPINSYHAHKGRQGISGNQHQYKFHCAQLMSTQKDHRKHNNPEKQCDTQHTDTFTCQGWLTLNIEDINANTYAAIWIVHKMNHVPYEWVEVPADIQKMIEANDSQTFDDVSTNNYSIFVYNFF